MKKLNESLKNCPFKGSKITLEYIADWKMDEWIKFIAISPFILEPILKEKHLYHYALWINHLKYVRILLQEGISFQDIDKAEKICISFRRDLIKVVPEFSRPNFHSILHIFEHCRIWGPPILFWTRPFEQRHKTLNNW